MKDKKYYESLDKRTREYKDWKLSQIEVKEPIGLGDVVEKITTVTGIKQAVKAIFGDDCGCKERKDALNKIKLPQRWNAKRCLTEEQYNQYKAYRERRTLEYLPADVKLLIDLCAHVFALQYNQADLCINCKGSYKIIKNIETKLDIVFESYTEL